MPTVGVGRDRLFAALGKTYSQLPLSQSQSPITFFFFLIARNDDIVWFSLNFTAQEEFEELCFRFGIELDDVVSISFSLPAFFWFINIEMVNLLFELFQTTEKAIIRKEKHLEDEGDDDEEVIYKIEVPANRYFTILYTNI